jgi:hypothetical protein
VNLLYKEMRDDSEVLQFNSAPLKQPEFVIHGAFSSGNDSKNSNSESISGMDS